MNQENSTMADQRLHELLVRAELEDCKLLDKDESAFLAFCGIARVSQPAAESDGSASPAEPAPYIWS